jgi:hypothetical protein
MNAVEMAEYLKQEQSGVRRQIRRIRRSGTQRLKNGG